MAGTKGNSGRKKGVPNKRTQSIIDQLVGLNCDPIKGMAKIAEKAMEEGDLHLALAAFKDLAQYVAPKRKSIEVTGELDLNQVQDILVTFKDLPVD